MPRATLLNLIALITATLVLVACASTNPGTASPPTPSPVSLPPEVAAAVDAAMTDAASYLGISRDQLHADRVEPQQWPDSSLGCPQPGQLYSQIVTPGYLIVVSAPGKQLEYHTDTRGHVTLCRES